MTVRCTGISYTDLLYMQIKATRVLTAQIINLKYLIKAESALPYFNLNKIYFRLFPVDINSSIFNLQ